jgi:hypothetical protein
MEVLCRGVPMYARVPTAAVVHGTGVVGHRAHADAPLQIVTVPAVMCMLVSTDQAPSALFDCQILAGDVARIA